MKIQLISNNNKNITTNQEYKKNTLAEPNSFEMYDINIVDLQNENLWTNEKDSNQSIDNINDFNSLNTLIKSSSNYVVIALPHNYTFYKDKKSNNQYWYSLKLKDMIPNLQGILKQLLPQSTYGYYSLIYENAKTQLGNEIYDSAFYFNSPLKAITTSYHSDHATTVQISEKCFMTTLDIYSPNCSIDTLLCACGIIEDSKNYPEWLFEIEKFDDKAQKDLISCNNERIASLKEENTRATDKLDENMRFKSILANNGQPLVSVVFEILEKMLSYDLSQFKDENKEDFLIKIGNLTFIGEIKGVTSNVKSEHISQLDVHYQGYIENLPSDSPEKVYSLLIINPFRTKPLGEREPVHENQIKLARRNQSLIITTELLLTLFEKHLRNEISTEKIKELFTTQIGLIDLSK